MGGTETTLGRIQNLMANDAQMLLQLAPVLNNAIISPLQIIGCFVWLAMIIGPSFLGGLVAMFLLFPFQGKVFGAYFTAQFLRLKETDERVKRTNEMVQGMRVVKMYAWEQTVSTMTLGVRAKELKYVRTQRYLSATLSVFIVVQARAIACV